MSSVMLPLSLLTQLIEKAINDYALCLISAITVDEAIEAALEKEEYYLGPEYANLIKNAIAKAILEMKDELTKLEVEKVLKMLPKNITSEEEIKKSNFLNANSSSEALDEVLKAWDETKATEN